ncbi:NAD(P)-dependent oxidoreductase [Streptomyces sp. NPDC002004]
MQKIAFLGLGHMGAPMARQLLRAGHPLTVWNRTPAKAEPLAAEGATAAADPAEAVRGADVVITMLADPAAVAHIADTIVPELRPGAYWVEMSTIGPDAVEALAARLGHDAHLVDAPVVGSTDRAEAGELRILAGGDADGVEEVLSRFGTVTRTGPLGSGAALKLVVNTAILGGVTLVAEAMTLADRLGIEENVARETLANGPLGGAVHRAFARDLHFATALAVKDMHLATSTASLPVLEAMRAHYAAAATDPGLAHEDISEVVAHIGATQG